MKILLDDITVDPNQPRKTFNPAEIDELAQSISQVGLLQPVGVRELTGKKGNKTYMIVYGERRFRALQELQKGLPLSYSSIEAVLIEESDKEEILKMQLIENAQRVDITPLEEAEAILNLTDKYDKEEIADHLGKSVYYIKQRLILVDLIDPFKALLNSKEIDVLTAIKIASATDKYQQEVYARNENKENVKWINFFKGKELNIFPESFVTDQGDLMLTMTPCNQCQFNSACASLFPDDGIHTCSNSLCFTIKEHAFITDIIANAISDPNAVLFMKDYDDILEYLRPVIADTKVYKQSDIIAITIPQVPEDSDYMMDDPSNEDEEIMDPAAYEAAIAEYNQEVLEYEESIKKPGVLIAYYVGDNTNYYPSSNTYCYLRNSQVKSSAEVKAALADTKAGDEIPDDKVAIIKAEIDRINTKEIRAEELDCEKISTLIDAEIWPNINNEKLKLCKPYNGQLALIFALSESIDYSLRSEKEALIKKVNFMVAEDHKKATSLQDLEPILGELQLLFIRSKLKGTGHKGYMGNTIDALKYNFALDLFPYETQVIVDTQNEKRANRKEKIKVRIKELKALLSKTK